MNSMPTNCVIHPQVHFLVHQVTLVYIVDKNLDKNGGKGDR